MLYSTRPQHLSRMIFNWNTNNITAPAPQQPQSSLNFVGHSMVKRKYSKSIVIRAIKDAALPPQLRSVAVTIATITTTIRRRSTSINVSRNLIAVAWHRTNLFTRSSLWCNEVYWQLHSICCLFDHGSCFSLGGLNNCGKCIAIQYAIINVRAPLKNIDWTLTVSNFNWFGWQRFCIDIFDLTVVEAMGFAHDATKFLYRHLLISQQSCEPCSASIEGGFYVGTDKREECVIQLRVVFI